MDIEEFFKSKNKVALAFSGGVDSSYLLYEAIHLGVDITAYYVKSQFQPEFELEDAKRLAKELNAKIKVLNLDILSIADIVKNDSQRCYFCKKTILSLIKKESAADGCSCVIDGTNASDDISDRPGFKALQEFSICSPLRDCGIEKDEVRIRLRRAGVFTWNKPAYACLATRIPTNTFISEELLDKTEKAEDFLFSLGFKDFRIRYSVLGAKLQLTNDDIPLLLGKRNEVYTFLKELYPEGVLLDLKER